MYQRYTANMARSYVSDSLPKVIDAHGVLTVQFFSRLEVDGPTRRYTLKLDVLSTNLVTVDHDFRQDCTALGSAAFEQKFPGESAHNSCFELISRLFDLYKIFLSKVSNSSASAFYPHWLLGPNENPDRTESY